MSSPRCLVIAPDREFAYVLSGIISRHGLDVDIANDPFDALRVLRGGGFDLLVYDVSSDLVDHETVLATLERDLPAVLKKTVLLTTSQLDATHIPKGVPVVGKNDLKPLMRYLTIE